MIPALRPATVPLLLALAILGAVPWCVGATSLDLAKLPLPRGAKPVSVTEFSAIYAVNAPAEATTQDCEKLLFAQGWEPYGSAGLTRYYKRGTTRLLATVKPEVGRTDRTMITYMAETMAADLPLPPDTEEVQYNDASKRLGFFSNLPPDAVADFYRQALAPAGWSTTMKKPGKSDFKDVIIFRNPENAKVEIEMTAGSGRTYTTVTYSTAEEVAAEKRRVAALLSAHQDKLAKEAAEGAPKVTLPLPAGTISKALTKQNLRLNLPAGQAKAAVETLRQGLLAAGWKEEAGSLEAAAGTLSLRRESHTLNILYMDPGFMPADVTITPVGVEIELTGDADGS